MKTGIIIGAAPLGAAHTKLKKHIEDMGRENIVLVAADGGIEFCIKENIKPDLYIGDMDSTEFSENAVRGFFLDIDIKTYPVKKDDTDMKLAADEAINKGCRDIYIYGGLGGSRESHSVANIQLINMYARNGINAYLVNEKQLMYVLYSDGKQQIKREYGSEKTGFISIFSLSDVSKNVSIKGLLYEYEGELVNYRALGVSNEFCGKKGSVSIMEGSLLITEE